MYNVYRKLLLIYYNAICILSSISQITLTDNIPVKNNIFTSIAFYTVTSLSNKRATIVGTEICTTL